MSNPATPMVSNRSLLAELTQSLRQFTSSSSRFRIVRTINPSRQPPRTLYILDSSFNPPSIAHLTLATSALRNHPFSDLPARLVLLFSTHNADKVSAPAQFEHRLAMMTLFAQDVLSHMRSSQKTRNPVASSTPATSPSTAVAITRSPSLRQQDPSIPIDVALTTQPYYTDKTSAIEAVSSSVYSSSSTTTAAITHVHLMGYDTFVRLLDPKYYTSFFPPLAALAPYFQAGHRIRVTRRVDDADSSGRDSGELQAELLERLRRGEMEDLGADRAWAEQIEMVEGENEGVGVSSTKIREAARNGDWDLVERMCTPSVGAWVRDMGLYKDEGVGKG